ncbi:ABC transporter substrate-binding protein [Bacillus sp. JCM 19041]|uniref:ABC transporter substrate-binding protein n=1 Tax=Bacillus sp. JCM 19041 TaxID=1460637 RepID=UPI000AF45DEA
MVLTSANSIQDIKRQIELIGETLQKTSEAEGLINEIDERLTELNSVPLHNEPSVLLVYGAPGSNLAALPNSLGGDLLEAAGGINVAASFEQLQEFPQYAALSPERIIEANPDIVLFMAHGDPVAVEDSFIREMEQHAGWSQLPAVQEGRLDVLPADLFGTNPGTRIIEALEHMRELLDGVGAEE